MDRIPSRGVLPRFHAPPVCPNKLQGFDSVPTRDNLLSWTRSQSLRGSVVLPEVDGPQLRWYVEKQCARYAVFLVVKATG